MKDDFVRFTGTLSGYTQSPFLLTWDNAKVNPEDLRTGKASGEEAGGQGRRRRRSPQ